MATIEPAGNGAALTPAQQAAVDKLHQAATQLEGVFVGMLFKQMHEGQDKSDIFGQKSNADDTWQDMLDEKRADEIAKTGSFGIAKMVEQQLRASVIASATPLPGSGAAAPEAGAAQVKPATPYADPALDGESGE